MAKTKADETQEVVVPAPTPEPGIPEETQKLAPTYKEIQPGDIIPGKSLEESQAIYDEQRALQHPPKE